MLKLLLIDNYIISFKCPSLHFRFSRNPFYKVLRHTSVTRCNILVLVHRIIEAYKENMCRIVIKVVALGRRVLICCRYVVVHLLVSVHKDRNHHKDATIFNSRIQKQWTGKRGSMIILSWNGLEHWVDKFHSVGRWAVIFMHINLLISELDHRSLWFVDTTISR